MLELVCYLLALVFAVLAVVGPPHPALDRVRLLAAAFGAYTVPFLVHAAQAV